MNDLDALVPPQRTTLQQRVYGELRNALMLGQFRPGRTLTIRALAAALGTSSMPVREALRQLVAESAVELLPSRSFGVPRLSRARYDDLLRVRCLLEGHAARQAAMRISSAELQSLYEADTRMLAASEAGDHAGYMRHNHDFHFTIYRAAGSQVILPMIETLWLQIGPYVGYVMKAGSRSDIGLGAHEAIVAALARRDPEAAERLLIADIEGPAEAIRMAAETDRWSGRFPRRG